MRRETTAAGSLNRSLGAMVKRGSTRTRSGRPFAPGSGTFSGPVPVARISSRSEAGSASSISYCTMVSAAWAASRRGVTATAWSQCTR